MTRLLITLLIVCSTVFVADAMPLNDHAKLADTYYTNRNFQEAVYHYSRALETDRNDAVLYFKRARAHLMINNYEEYLSDLQMALDLDPELPSNLADRELISYQIH